MSSSGATLGLFHLFIFYLSIFFIFVSYSLDIRQQHTTQPLEIFFCSQLFWPADSDVFNVSMFGSALIKCSLLPVFAESLECLCQLFIWRNDLLTTEFLLVSQMFGAGLGHLLISAHFHPLLTRAAPPCKLAVTSCLSGERRGKSPYGSCET